MRNDPAARLEFFQLWYQPDIEFRQQVQRDDVNAAQVEFENVLLVNGNQILNLVASDIVKRFPNALRVDVDLRLEPGHAFYEVPRPSEKVCIRPAVLEFPQCEAIARPGSPNGEDNGALVAGLGLGKIDGLRVYDDGVYELTGTFGTVIIHSGRPFLRLTGT